MSDTKPPSTEAMAFADWVLEFLVGYKTWAIEGNRSAVAQRIDAFAERRAAEERGEWAEIIEMVQAALSEATGKSAGGFAPMCWNDAIRLLAKDPDERAAGAARRAAIEECAAKCDEAAADLRRRAGFRSDGEAHLFGIAAETFDTASAFIRDLADKPAADKGEP